MSPTPRRGRRLEVLSITPEPSAPERTVLIAALETALATEARSIPASGWSAPQYQDGTSLRPGSRAWAAGAASDAPRQPAAPRPPQRSG